MKVNEVMATEVATCTASTKVQEVAKMMLEHDCGAIPVLETADSSKPIGIITDRDIAVRLVAQGRDPLGSTVRDAMTPQTVSVRPESDVEDAARAMQKNRLRRVLVVADDGSCVGMVSLADLADALPERASAGVLRQVSRPNPQSATAA
jgi:CBS domain-containing protein